MRIASATFSTLRPPDKMIRREAAARRAKSQSVVCPVPPYWPARMPSRRKANTSENLSNAENGKLASTRNALITGSELATRETISGVSSPWSWAVSKRLDRKSVEAGGAQTKKISVRAQSGFTYRDTMVGYLVD